MRKFCKMKIMLVTTLILSVILTLVLLKIYRNKKKIMVVLGSGGHTSEMLKLINKIPSEYTLIYVISSSDKTSLAKLNGTETIFKIPRSRKVGQSKWSTVLTFLYSAVCSLKLYYYNPQIILCNGPGVCLPICLMGIIGGIKVVYVESICRTEQLSVSGRLLYHVSTVFLVQWEGLLKKYPKARYYGRLV